MKLLILKNYLDMLIRKKYGLWSFKCSEIKGKKMVWFSKIILSSVVFEIYTTLLCIRYNSILKCSKAKEYLKKLTPVSTIIFYFTKWLDFSLYKIGWKVCKYEKHAHNSMSN